MKRIWKLILISLSLLAVTTAMILPAVAAETTAVALMTREKAVEAAQAKVSGTLLDLELDADNGRLRYEVELLDADGYRNHIEVDVLTGDVLRSYAERKGKEYSYREYKNVKVTWGEALGAATEAVENSTAGDLSLYWSWNELAYSVTVYDAAGIEHRVRVDAGTGDVLSTRRDDDVPAGKTAAITPAAAATAALNAIGGGVVARCELDYDDGALIYKVLAADERGAACEVEVSAATGRVLETDWDD